VPIGLGYFAAKTLTKHEQKSLLPLKSSGRRHYARTSDSASLRVGL
jgi:hypothetical protein